jgi:uncharacterized protein YfiM (DUF2279 family)
MSQLKRFLTGGLFLLAITAAQANETDTATAGSERSLNRDEKALLLNAGAATLLTVWGILKWDYGQRSPHAQNEGWFARSTKQGGADKLGHFWTSYALSHLYATVYRSWDFSDREANLYGALSSLGFQTFMELGDSFSDFGLSYEDLIMNTLGAASGYVLGRYPELASKIDFRMEYTPDLKNFQSDVFTDYDHQKYLVAIKAEGFESISNPVLKYLEFHFGYFARGYDHFHQNGPDHRKRTLYVGIGFNLSRFVQRSFDTRVFNYFQMPYTSVRFDNDLD